MNLSDIFSFFEKEKIKSLREGMDLWKYISNEEVVVLRKDKNGNLLFFRGDPDECWDEAFEEIEADDSIAYFSDYDLEDLFFLYLRKKGVKKFVEPYFLNWRKKYFNGNFLKKEALNNELLVCALKEKGVEVK